MNRSDLYKINVATVKISEVAIDEVKKCQNQIASIDEQANADKIQVVKRYNQLKQPQFEKRSKLLQKLRQFWLRALQNHPILTYDIVDEEGRDCLDYLQNLTVQDEETLNSSGYAFIILFYFNDNPYFFNEVLWKKYTISVQGERSSNNSEIKWKDGMKPTMNNRDGNSRKRKPIVTCQFLEWFNDNNSNQNSVIADAIRDEIWQNPSTYIAPNLVVNDLKRSSSVVVVEHRPDDEIIVLSSDNEMDIEEGVPDIQELKKILREVEDSESSDGYESEGSQTSGSGQMSTEDSDDDK